MEVDRASIEKLRNDAAEAALISGLATDKTKREMYARLHQQLQGLANDDERAMKSKAAESVLTSPGLQSSK
jgi:hypothetical protein